MTAAVRVRTADIYELTLVVASAAAAVLSLAAPALQAEVQSPSLAAALGSPAALAGYNVATAAAAAVVVVGAVITARNAPRPHASPVLGLALERAGLGALGLLMLAYAVAVASSAGSFAALVPGGIGVAHLVRARRLHHDLADIRAITTPPAGTGR